MSWRCPQCRQLNNDDHSWCPDCGPCVEMPDDLPRVRIDGRCPVCLEPIAPDQLYVVDTGSHVRCV